jgi:hypothetical protein
VVGTRGCGTEDHFRKRHSTRIPLAGGPFVANQRARALAFVFSVPGPTPLEDLTKKKKKKKKKDKTNKTKKIA